MYLCYTDESGDPGYASQGSPSRAFTLSALLVKDSDWGAILDRLKSMRGYFHQQFGVSRRIELKASHLVHRKGPFKTLGVTPANRMKMYEYAMRVQKDPRLTVFAVLIDKPSIQKPQSIDPRFEAWKMLVERVDNFAGRASENVMLFPDAGHGYFIRKTVRRMRRHHRVASAFDPGVFLEADASRFIEDPSDRDSRDSLFIQLADLNTYAAFRFVFPSEKMDGSYWEMIGDSRLLAVNGLRGGPDGVKVFPAIK